MSESSTPPPSGESKKDGFHLRGLEMTRIETFTDAAFAFALTLLVIANLAPTDYASMMESLREVPAFLCSGFILMLFWHGHHVWSRRYGLDDATTIVLSCALVFTVLVYVYPLRFMFQTAMAFVKHRFSLPVSSSTDVDDLGSYSEVAGMFVTYGVGFIAMSLLLVLLYGHAWRRRDALGLDPIERFLTKAEMLSWMIFVGVGSVSVTTALWLPDGWPALPGLTYLSLFILVPGYEWLVKRRRGAMRAASGRLD